MHEVSAFRRQYQAEQVGPHYSGWAHLGFTSAGSLAAIAYAAAQVHDVRPLEWLVLPLGFLFANLVEYFGHKDPMHHPRRGLRILHQRHTLEHHRYYMRGAMAADSARDFRMVLFPPVMLVFFLGVIAAPLALGLGTLASANAGWLFAVLAMSYFLSYEWLHLAYHVRESSFVGRLPLLAILRRHHTAHHDPALMQRWNFNITFPVMDFLFGTRYSDDDSSGRGGSDRR